MELNLAAVTGDLDTFSTMLWAWSVEFLPRLAAAAVILLLGFVIAGWIARLIGSAILRARHVDATVGPIAATAGRYAVLIIAVIAALGQLGVQTTSLLAVLGAAGLAIGLALQGTLANVAAGIMLLYLRPFRTGDAIETPAVAGTVKEVGLFVTRMETADGVFYFVPNSSLWNVPLKNYSRSPRRLAIVQTSVGYASDLAEVRRILLELADADPRVLSSPAPAVTIDGYTDYRVMVSLRAWTASADLGDVQRSLAEDAKARLQAAGISLPGVTAAASPPAREADAPASEG
jgi:small conductance mechanosensitive channel